MEHTVPSENFPLENRTTFSEVLHFLEIFQWNEPKNHVPFTAQPEFPESLGKWKTPNKTFKPCKKTRQQESWLPGHKILGINFTTIINLQIQ